LDLFARSGNGQSFAIGAVGNHGVECIRNSEYPCSERNLFGAQPAWISGTVVTFLVRKHNLRGLFQEGDALENLIANVTMAAA